MPGALADEPCDPDASGEDPLTEDEYADYLAELDDDVWDVIDGHHLEAAYSFEDFRDALEFTYEIGELAEDVWHHPDITLSWGEVGVELFTHEIDGLQKADFVMAARMDRLHAEYLADEE